MSRRRYVKGEKYEYTQLPSVYDTADGIDPMQFEKPKQEFPWRPTIFVISFLLGGTICLTLGFLISFGIIEEKYQDRAWPLFILGAIMFIPGGYYGWIIICVIFHKCEYTVEDIPAF